MSRYILNRLLQAAIVLLVMSFVIYSLIGLMPGDPIDLMIAANPGATPETVAHLRVHIRPRSAHPAALLALARRGIAG